MFLSVHRLMDYVSQFHRITWTDLLSLCVGSDLIFTALHAGISGSGFTEEMIQNCVRKICKQPKPAWADTNISSRLQMKHSE